MSDPLHVTKNVALTPSSFNISNILLVVPSLGPSSKVRYIVPLLVVPLSTILVPTITFLLALLLLPLSSIISYVRLYVPISLPTVPVILTLLSRFSSQLSLTVYPGSIYLSP